MEKKRFVKPYDIFQTILHFSLAIGVLAAAAFVTGPTLIIIAAGFSALLYKAQTFVANHLVDDMFEKQDLSGKDSPRLGQMVRELSNKLGLAIAPPVLDFRTKLPDKSKKPSTPQLPEQETEKSRRAAIQKIVLEKMVNAAALDLGKPRVIISTPLLKLLDDKEEYGVLAHEFSHIGAKHIRLKAAHSAITATAGIAVALFLLKTSFYVDFSSQLASLQAMSPLLDQIVSKAPVIATAANWVPLLTAIGVTAVAHKLKESYFPQKKLTDREIEIQVMTNQKSRTFLGVVPFLVLACFSPLAMAWAFAANRFILWSNRLIAASYSRRKEFQTDRNAVTELNADPLALTTGLRKLTAVIKRDYPELAERSDYTRGPFLQRLWRRARTLTRSHPNVARRARQLAILAQRFGRSEQEITAALHDPVDISALPPSPQAAAGARGMLHR